VTGSISHHTSIIPGAVVAACMLTPLLLDLMAICQAGVGILWNSAAVCHAREDCSQVRPRWCTSVNCCSAVNCEANGVWHIHQATFLPCCFGHANIIEVNLLSFLGQQYSYSSAQKGAC
jgi:hypothetical protein